MILNAGGGYHVLLAGMDRISVDLGQFVLTGEPVAVMGAATQATAAPSTGAKEPVLYVEFRKTALPLIPALGGRQTKARRFADDAQSLHGFPRCSGRRRGNAACDPATRNVCVGSAARAAASDTYQQLNLFGDVFERVRADYVEKPDDRS